MDATHQLALRYAQSHPRAAARRLGDIEGSETATFLEALEHTAAAALIAEFRPQTAADILARVSIDHAAGIVTMLNLNHGVAVLRLQPREAREAILQILPAALASRIRIALANPAGTAGSLADAAIPSFDAETTVGEVQSCGVDPRFPYLYVVDGEHRLMGVVHIRILQRSKENLPLRSIMTSPVQSVAATAPITSLHQHAAWSTLDALPVVDGRGVLVGVIRHKVLRATTPPTTATGPTLAP